MIYYINANFGFNLEALVSSVGNKFVNEYSAGHDGVDYNELKERVIDLLSVKFIKSLAIRR